MDIGRSVRPAHNLNSVLSFENRFQGSVGRMDGRVASVVVVG